MCTNAHAFLVPLRFMPPPGHMKYYLLRLSPAKNKGPTPHARMSIKSTIQTAICIAHHTPLTRVLSALMLWWILCVCAVRDVKKEPTTQIPTNSPFFQNRSQNQHCHPPANLVSTEGICRYCMYESSTQLRRVVNLLLMIKSKGDAELEVCKASVLLSCSRVFWCA